MVSGYVNLNSGQKHFEIHAELQSVTFSDYNAHMQSSFDPLSKADDVWRKTKIHFKFVPTCASML